ncbi:MAG: MFS transporter [Fimbriimonadaceae bacterium]
MEAATQTAQPLPTSPFAYRDFRLLWIGAFLSFMGSWIQNIAQGWLVFEMTRDPAKLGLVTFLGMAPVSLFGPFAGSLADMFNKRTVLILTQAVFACGSLFLAAATYFGFVEYWHILIVAVVVGMAGCIEMPTRQSIVSRVVPPELLPKAIPFNAMTFNLARLLGPAIGAVLLANFGPEVCYGVNGLSYIALILAAMAIKADLSAMHREPQPIKDLLFEGLLYTMRDKRLKTLFFMEATVSAFGLFYLPLMPAIAKEMLGLDKIGLGWAMTSVGVGAISGLLLMTRISHKPVRAMTVRVTMTTFALAMFVLSVSTTPYLAFPMLALMGMSAIMQFNTTNTLFQLLSPEHLRGRVLAMHIWALAGAGSVFPFLFGGLASQTSLRVALAVGASCVLIGAIAGWLNRKGLVGVE